MSHFSDSSSAAFMENSCNDLFMKAIVDDTDQVLPRQLHILETLIKTFDAVVCGIACTDADDHEIQRIASLLHDFQHTGGYGTMLNCVQSLVHKMTWDDFPPSGEMNGSSHVNENNTSSRLSSRFPVVEQKLRDLFIGFANMCKLVKELKVNYLHGIDCTRRWHRDCDISTLRHQHHDILGIAVSRYKGTDTVITNITKRGNDGISQGGDFDKKPSKKMKTSVTGALPPTSCVIGTAVHFLIREIFPISPSCVGFVMSSLDTIGICHCVRPCTIAVPLLSSLQHLERSGQDIVLATIGQALLQRMGDSSHQPKSVPDGFVATFSWCDYSFFCGSGMVLLGTYFLPFFLRFVSAYMSKHQIPAMSSDSLNNPW